MPITADDSTDGVTLFSTGALSWRRSELFSGGAELDDMIKLDGCMFSWSVSAVSGTNCAETGISVNMDGANVVSGIALTVALKALRMLL